MYTAGPISGMITQPIIGAFSDNMKPYPLSKMGQRRPFILAGCILIVCSLIIFSNSRYIGNFFGDNKTSNNNIGLGIGID